MIEILPTGGVNVNVRTTRGLVCCLSGQDVGLCGYCRFIGEGERDEA